MKNTTNMEGECFVLQPDNGHEVDQQHNGPKALDVVYNSFNRIDDIGAKSVQRMSPLSSSSAGQDKALLLCTI